MSGFRNFIEKKNGSELSTASTTQLREELNGREKIVNHFPLDVFHDNIKPFLSALNNRFDLPRSYIGLSLLAVYSTAIGSAYAVSPNGTSLIYLPVWGCLSGISSSGKSLAIDMIHSPLLEIQAEFDREWDENISGQNEEARRRATMKTVIFRDVHLATLTRSIMPDNPKGLLKFADEIMEWINGMNQMSNKEGTDEQFWLSSWNCKNFSGIRSGKDKFVIPRPFVNVIGGVQPTIIHKLFAKDRDTTGFIFRLLFAVPDVVKIAEPDSNYAMPAQYMEIHRKVVRKLYFELNIEDEYEAPKKCILTKEAIALYDAWTKKRIRAINNMDDIVDKEIHSGILGKIKEYALRFAGILKITDRAFALDDSSTFDFFNNEEPIDSFIMERALRLADYFYQSAADTYETAQTKVSAPPEVLIAATLFRQKATYESIAHALYGDGKKFRQKAFRNVRRWIRDYPKVFGAQAR